MAEAAVRKLDDAREQKDALYREAPTILKRNRRCSAPF